MIFSVKEVRSTTEEKSTPIWKVMLVSGIVSAVSTLGLYYAEHPGKLSQTKNYFLKKFGYDIEGIRRGRENGMQEEEISQIVERQVYKVMKKYFPDV